VNYRHIYHAGNFADVLKHAVLALCIEYLQRKEKPFCVLDTHAGLGAYDLSQDEAQRTGEFHDGISRILADPDAPEVLAPYLDIVRRMNQGAIGEDGSVRHYPGSPWVARQMLREDDRLIGCELHPDDFEVLADNFARDRQSAMFHQDAYQGLRAHLPPRERRGLVLIDPPFEVRDEFGQILRGLVQAFKRFSQGTYMIWYPIKDRQSVDAFWAGLDETVACEALQVELYVKPLGEEGLPGTGLAILNPPYVLTEQLGPLLPYLAEKLAIMGSGDFRLKKHDLGKNIDR